MVPASSLSYSVKVSSPTQTISKLNRIDFIEKELLSPISSIDAVDIVVGAKYFEFNNYSRLFEIPSSHFG